MAAADPCVYAPERHGSLQNALSVHTQLRGLLRPVEDQQRFRDARGGLRLDLDDLFLTGEEIPLEAVADTRRLALVATVVDLESRRPVAGPLPLAMSDDQMSHRLELPPVPAGTYRVEVTATGATAAGVQPVHGLFVVTTDDEGD